MTLTQIFKYDPLLTYDALIDRNMLLKGVSKDKLNYPFVDENTYVGIEVEVEGILTTNNQVKMAEKTYLWLNTEDNSLRNNGREFVSMPVRGGHIEYALSRLNTLLNKSKTCIGHSFTDRTSVHVHVNVRDLTTEELRNLIIVYAIVEPLLYEFGGMSRYNNIFCVPLKETDSDNFRDIIFDCDQSVFDNFISYPQRDWHKYYALNLLPVSSYGTVEFRHMVGNCDVEKLCSWINMLLCIKKYAKSVKFDDLLSIVETLNSTSEYSGFLNSVFGDVATVFYKSNFGSVLDEAVSTVKLWTHTKSALEVYKNTSVIDKKGYLYSLLKAYSYFSEKKVTDNDKKITTNPVQDGVNLDRLRQAANALAEARFQWVEDVQAQQIPRGR